MASVVSSDFIQWLDLHTDRVLEARGLQRSEPTAILYQLAKVTEESGELCSEALITLGLARRSKLSRHDPGRLSKEVADTLIATLVLANILDVNIEEAIVAGQARHDQRSGHKTS